MKHKYTIKHFLLGIFCTLVLLAGCRNVVAEEALNFYLGLPYSSSTIDFVEQTISEKLGKFSVDSNGIYTANDYGYEMRLTLYSNTSGVGFNRLTLCPAGECWGYDTQFQQLVERDIGRFIDIESKLTNQYGEPDFRFFYTDGGKYGKSNLTRFMLPTLTWTDEAMKSVYDEDSYLIAYSIWGNLTLRLWADGLNERTRGYLTHVEIIFENASSWEKAPEITLYP